MRQQLSEVCPVLREHGLGQPAHTALLIFPDVFQDIRHLQALAKGYRKSHQFGTLPIDAFAMIAKQFR